MSLHKKKLYGSATVGTKGQVVIPADARDELGIQTGDRLYVVGSPEMKWVGFIKEEQLREIIDKVTDDVQGYKKLLNN
ncbi:MAG TPA: AbrB/MazE/SpoVT family DNA-binding domain-containing protein [Candidatus Saccharibacteria bacterium]|nr:AbrB/MazE/SpoVT family DNA-binding domain-containing protein [Candidatus Saccharibacteria bacterium]